MVHSQTRTPASILAALVVFLTAVLACAATLTPQALADPARADARAYNAAVSDLANGRYGPGLGALAGLAATSPNDANVAALQALYASTTGDVGTAAAARDRLGRLNPGLAGGVDRALGAIFRSAGGPIFYGSLRGPGTAIVILGFGLLPDGSMRPELIDRLTAGLTAARISFLSPVIVTGGNPRNGIAEADAMRAWLIGAGIPDFRIRVDRRASQTTENAVNSTAMLASVGAVDAVLATSPNHIRRAMSDFITAGANIVGAVSSDPWSSPVVPPTAPAALVIDAAKVIGVARSY